MADEIVVTKESLEALLMMHEHDAARARANGRIIAARGAEIQASTIRLALECLARRDADKQSVTNFCPDCAARAAADENSPCGDAERNAVVVKVYFDGDPSNGTILLDDEISVSCKSGDFGGEKDGEFSFIEQFRSFVARWYDGSSVVIMDGATK